MSDKLDFDPYEMLDVNEGSSEKEIVSGFRKMALKWHPDKNPQRLDMANEMFLKIQKAFEILTDAAAKSALDRLRKARQAAKQRTRHLDEKRRKLKEELESREQNSNVEKEDEVKASRNFEAEIERLRKEGSKLLQKEKEELDKRINEERLNRQSPLTFSADSAENSSRLKVQWKKDKEGQFYTTKDIEKIFSKYGAITALIVNKSSKKGSALVEFADANSAHLAVKCEIGSPECPLQVTWVTAPSMTVQNPPSPSLKLTGTTFSSDFESHILTKMKQAEERKRLVEEMLKNDPDANNSSTME